LRHARQNVKQDILSLNPYIGLVKERDNQVEFSPRKIEKGYNFFFSLEFSSRKLKKETWMWAFKTDTKQALTFNLDMFRHIRKHEQEYVYIDIINYKIESWKFGPQYIMLAR